MCSDRLEVFPTHFKWVNLHQSTSSENFKMQHIYIIYTTTYPKCSAVDGSIWSNSYERKQVCIIFGQQFHLTQCLITEVSDERMHFMKYSWQDVEYQPLIANSNFRYILSCSCSISKKRNILLWSSGKGKGKGWTQEGHSNVIYGWWMVDGGYPFPDALH